MQEKEKENVSANTVSTIDPEEPKTHWGTRLLEKIKKKGKPQKTSPGQMNLWDELSIHPTNS